MASKASAVHLNGSGEKMFVISRHCTQEHISQDCQQAYVPSIKALPISSEQVATAEGSRELTSLAKGNFLIRSSVLR